MKTLILVTSTVLLSALHTTAQDNQYTANNGLVSFFCEGTITDVDAKNKNVDVILNTKNRELTFDMAMADFEFESRKMGRDAEKSWLETRKYPKASFKGKISDDVDFDKAGSYAATAKGKLMIHGTEKDVTINGKVVVSKDQIKLTSDFNVVLEDYTIETPTILGKEMTDGYASIKVAVTLSSATKKISQRN